jgi:hypothetical protein
MGDGKAAVMEFDEAAARAALRWAGTQAPDAARSRWQFPLSNKHHVRGKIASEKEKIGR